VTDEAGFYGILVIVRSADVEDCVCDVVSVGRREKRREEKRREEKRREEESGRRDRRARPRIELGSHPP
jgi:hypothetical protein